MTRPLLGEALGTFLLVLVGVGSVAASALHGVPDGLPAVAACWGLGVALAILAARPLSPAHLNPAISLAVAIARPAEFPRRRILPFAAAQTLGAALAGAAVLLLFGVRAVPVLRESFAVPAAQSLLWEAGGTAVLALVVLALPGPRWAPAIVGVTVTVLVLVVAPRTGAGLNPARDLGPRIAAASGPWDGWWVYLAGPMAGGALAGWLRSRRRPAT